MESNIQVALSAEIISRCFPVVRELRPHLTEEEFLARVQRQQQQGGYQLAFLEVDREVRSVAGFRFLENLAWGRFLYVDDLVTRACDHGSRFGSTLFDWLVQQAKLAGCQELHLDSGVQRFGAHRFYLHKGMNITSHHFARSLAGE
ncbi:MAG: GNAT family N-acetyltransferase [Verrucomicrobiaceae bacterium]|nr:MAG: GNAT family N-acetyltransferase [Verrucomicrobiaceae bacterium]